ncbi:uncharacterized protein LOC126847911 isoform X2 [Adelges cooleyi]|nr:uncharacterized protein LOC126847911 isoform X2 [Adelges cooleyi]
MEYNYVGYSHLDVLTGSPTFRIIQEEEDIKGTVVIPFISGLTERIARVARKYGTRTVFPTVKKLEEIFRSPKNELPKLQTHGESTELQYTCGTSVQQNDLKSCKYNTPPKFQ